MKLIDRETAREIGKVVNERIRRSPPFLQDAERSEAQLGRGRPTERGVRNGERRSVAGEIASELVHGGRLFQIGDCIVCPSVVAD